MPKPKIVFVCDSCGAQQPKWQGQCPDCGAWNTLSESRAPSRESIREASAAGEVALTRLDGLDATRVSRVSTGLGEFDRVLGGGLVPGGVVLLGGDPGIGKSTLLLRALANLAVRTPACYVTGEESLDQIALRASRLGVGEAPLDMLAETNIERVLAGVGANRGLGVLAIDSIQTLYSEDLQSAPGSVSQVRECAGQLVRFAKERDVATLLIGHVTKEGTLAGPRVLEHMVDTVLYFESDVGSRFRIVRAAKNRFGAANELGFFVMAEDGFREVKNPSAIFLARHGTPVPGSVTLVTREGTRPVLVEVQALVDPGATQSPRRCRAGLRRAAHGLVARGFAPALRSRSRPVRRVREHRRWVAHWRDGGRSRALRSRSCRVCASRWCHMISRCSARSGSRARSVPCRSERSGSSKRRSTVSSARSCRARTCPGARSISRSCPSIA